ncbi:MAG: LURP-one-related family protein [Clostridia bacterium]|nr:LURP-one-related family protein [Clostridia bacterium]
MTLYFKNKFFSFGGGSAVKDESDKEFYIVKGKVFSARKKKRLCSLDGELIYRVQNKFFNFFKHSAFIFDKDGNKIATVSTKPFNFKKDFIVTGLKDNITISGSWLSFTMDIHRNGQVIGSITREIDLFRDSFKVTADEADMPLVIALVIAIDNIIDNKRNRNR